MTASLESAPTEFIVASGILVGTAPQVGEEHLLKVVEEAFSHKEALDVRLPLSFTPSKASQAAGRAFLKRASVRTVDRDPESGEAISRPQAKAQIDWCASKDPKNSILKAIDQPVLVVSGNDDTMVPDGNAYFPASSSPTRRQLQSRPACCVDRSFEYPVELELGSGPERGLAVSRSLLKYEANPSDKQCAVAHKIQTLFI
jgi:pimeloyl-ACP methyl ester carboxylesterase